MMIILKIFANYFTIHDMFYTMIATNSSAVFAPKITYIWKSSSNMLHKMHIISLKECLQKHKYVYNLGKIKVQLYVLIIGMQAQEQILADITAIIQSIVWGPM